MAFRDQLEDLAFPFRQRFQLEEIDPATLVRKRAVFGQERSTPEAVLLTDPTLDDSRLSKEIRWGYRIFMDTPGEAGRLTPRAARTGAPACGNGRTVSGVQQARRPPDYARGSDRRLLPAERERDRAHRRGRGTVPDRPGSAGRLRVSHVVVPRHGGGNQSTVVRSSASAAARNCTRPSSWLPLAGWQARLDIPNQRVENLSFAPMGTWMHVTTGPAAIFWKPGQTASGPCTVKATFALAKLPAHQEAY